MKPSTTPHDEWSVVESHTGVSLYSSDFTHDVMLKVTGDFKDDDQRVEYARGLAAKLNAPASENAEWIATSERRPEWGPQHDDVLAYTLTGHVLAAHPNRVHMLWETRADGEDCFYTHWRPMPKGPQ